MPRQLRGNAQKINGIQHARDVAHPAEGRLLFLEVSRMD
jgi:hypothetical protein